VIVPSDEKAGRSFARLSPVVSPRTPSSMETTSGSPLRCGTLTGAISASNVPSVAAFAASWCERAANASWSSRVTP
jgi:hypothetical protein